MRSIDVQKVDRPVGEFVYRLSERSCAQLGKTRVAPVVFRHLDADFRIEVAHMNVAAPCIDAIALRGNAVVGRRLAETEIRLAFPNSELDENLRPEFAHEVIGKGQMHAPVVAEIPLDVRSGVGRLVELRKVVIRVICGFVSAEW